MLGLKGRRGVDNRAGYKTLLKGNEETEFHWHDTDKDSAIQKGLSV